MERLAALLGSMETTSLANIPQFKQGPVGRRRKGDCGPDDDDAVCQIIKRIETITSGPIRG